MNFVLMHLFVHYQLWGKNLCRTLTFYIFAKQTKTLIVHLPFNAILQSWLCKNPYRSPTLIMLCQSWWLFEKPYRTPTPPVWYCNNFIFCLGVYIWQTLQANKGWFSFLFYPWYFNTNRSQKCFLWCYAMSMFHHRLHWMRIKSIAIGNLCRTHPPTNIIIFILHPKQSCLHSNPKHTLSHTVFIFQILWLTQGM